MKAVVWTCDRCGASVEVPREVLIVDEWTPAAVEKEPSEWRGLAGWQGFSDDEALTDVCPNCLTAEERADRLLREVSAPYAFDNHEQPGGGL